MLYAVNLARHTEQGWQDAALPDDFSNIAELLRLDTETARRIVGEPVAREADAELTRAGA